MRYTYDILKQLVDECDLTLARDYNENDKIMRNTVIHFECKYENCNNIVDRLFRNLYNARNFGCKTHDKVFRGRNIKKSKSVLRNERAKLDKIYTFDELKKLTSISLYKICENIKLSNYKKYKKNEMIELMLKRQNELINLEHCENEIEENENNDDNNNVNEIEEIEIEEIENNGVEETKEYEENDTDINENTSENNMMSIDNNKITFGNSHVKYLKDNNDNIWFKAKHVALILEYKNTKDAIINHIDEEDRITYDKLLTLSNGGRNIRPPPSIAGSQFISDEEDHQTIFINESGLYSIMLRSKLPKAKQFKRWVTSEVLPTIRKTGSYEFNSNLLITRYSNKNVIYCYKLKNYLNHYKFGITSDIERRENEHHREIGNIEPILIRETDNTKNVERDIKHVFKRKNLLVTLIINDKNQTEIIHFPGNVKELIQIFDNVIYENSKITSIEENTCIELELKREETRQLEIEHETKRCEHETKRREIELELKRLELNYKLEVMRFKHELET